MAPRRSNSGSTHVEFADATWAELASPTTTTPPRFDPATLSDLPAPAQRYLRRVLPDGVGLSSVVRLSMAGEIKLGGRWLPFSARQILRAGTGFVWAPVVGGRLLRFVGADALGVTGARLEFRLHGLIPVVRSSGPDVRRSAEGRLAAETVVWLPQALAPQSGARWSGIDDRRAVVSLDAGGTSVDVEVDVDDGGALRSLELQRWSDAVTPGGYKSFGGSVDSTLAAENGVGVAGSGDVGWDWATPQRAEGVFFRYRLTSVDFSDAPASPAV